MGDFSGIDPDAMQQMIKSFTGDAADLAGSAQSLKTAFGSLGLDTGPLDELIGISRWADDQAPMLRRRQALAAAMSRPGSGPREMVQVPEPVPTVKQAQADGTKAAADANAAEKLAGGPAGDAFHQVALELAAHRNDPDWTSAFYAGLDPRLAAQLPSVIAATRSSTGKEDMATFADAFRTAMHAANPAPGFDKVLALFQGPVPKDDPSAVWNRALMQQDDPDLWSIAWADLEDLFVPEHSWSTEGGILQGVLAGQAQYANLIRDRADRFAKAAEALHEYRVNSPGLTTAQRNAIKKLTGNLGRASAADLRQAEGVLAKFNLGGLSKLMNASVTDAASPLLRGAASDSEVLGKFLRVGEKVPVVGAVLTVGGTWWDIKNGTDPDVAVTANVGSLAIGAGAGWAMEAATIAIAGGPVGWAAGAGILVAAGVGYAAYRFLESDTGQKMIKGTEHAVEGAAKDIGHAAESVGHWLGL
ncbi:hypothetical protein AB0M29_02820 [Streptomyces sp. NPDC051976]|uniref:hypothetical protein n=1 Tax=Streptomyces sp. NPDC051976 TaxID=3154947 RepID=UPI00342159E1